ncbi:hypothetical protein IEO21_10023 [Rhodonia placenta]|uniref:Uncharacterized protein n=1 Tax=Rhodonia placenta TaxID=104341 RepID=A0A8H7NTC7_9APHY|nr:hypothetical protein IEO21_10023 [Postia placenta]
MRQCARAVCRTDVRRVMCLVSWTRPGIRGELTRGHSPVAYLPPHI